MRNIALPTTSRMQNVRKRARNNLERPENSNRITHACVRKQSRITDGLPHRKHNWGRQRPISDRSEPGLPVFDAMESCHWLRRAPRLRKRTPRVTFLIAAFVFGAATSAAPGDSCPSRDRPRSHIIQPKTSHRVTSQASGVRFAAEHRSLRPICRTSGPAQELSLWTTI